MAKSVKHYKRAERKIPSIRLQPKQQEFIDAKQSIVFFGGGAGGGKTFASLCANLMGIHDPLYFSVFFRTSSTEIDKGLWVDAKRMYMPYLCDANGRLLGHAKINEQQKTITFPSGARTTFSYLATDKDADAWYGTEINCAFFEEAQYRSLYQFDIIKSRNRSMSSVPKSIRCTLNPDPSSFIYDWVKPFLDSEDFPVKELSGKTRYYVVVEGQLITSWDKEQLEADTGKTADTYTYIPATLDDNAELEKLDPSYRTKLNSMPEAKRKQLLMGCWQSVEESCVYFSRDKLKKTSAIPMGCATCRAWDLAATSDDTPETKGCDATQGLKMSKSKDGYYYIHGSVRFRKRVGERDRLIVNTAIEDGSDVHVVIPQDNGSGGKAQFVYLSQMLISEGFVCKGDQSGHTASKLKKAEPFFSAVEAGLVYIIESSFEREELMLFYRELELFNNKKSSKTRHDESVDTCASAFNYLNKVRIYTVPRLAQVSQESPTLKAKLNL